MRFIAKVIDGVEYISIPDLKTWLLTVENSLLKESRYMESSTVSELLKLITKCMANPIKEIR